MDEVTHEGDLNQWFSTYGLITAERILSRYNISLPQNELIVALKSPFSFYHNLLQVPLKNLLNGIVLQQAHDYHVYVQKLFVDYLLSDESSKEPGSQGTSTREALEDERQNLINLGNEFQEAKAEHAALIASSQAVLIKLANEWNRLMEASISMFLSELTRNGHNIKKSKIRQAINHGIIHCDLTRNDGTVFIKKMNEIINAELNIGTLDYLKDLITMSNELFQNIAPFMQRCMEMSARANSFRTQFYDASIRVINMIGLLPEYRINEVQDQINKEILHFDNKIGQTTH